MIRKHIFNVLDNNAVYLEPFVQQELHPHTLKPNHERYGYRLSDHNSIVYYCELTLEQFLNQRQLSIGNIIHETFWNVRDALPILREISKIGWVFFDEKKINVTQEELGIDGINLHWQKLDRADRIPLGNRY